MSEKDAPPGDKAESRVHPKRESENPRERQRSFIRQRTAVLRPHDDLNGETNTQATAEREDAEAERDDTPPRAHEERRKLLAQYRRRQREK